MEEKQHMKKNLKKLIALALALTLMLGMMPLSAFATESDESAKKAQAVVEGPALQNGKGTLDLKLSTSEGNANTMWMVFSFDNTVVVPCDAATGEAVSGITDGAIDAKYSTCFTAGAGFSVLPAEWAVKGNRTAVAVTWMTGNFMAGTPITSLTQIGSFHYKLAENAVMKKGTFKLETDYSDGSFLKQLYAQIDEAQTIHLALMDGTSNLGYGDPNTPDSIKLNSFTYPGYDKQSLGALAIASAGDATSVAVPKVLGDDASTQAATLALTATAEDTDGDAMQTFPTVTWSFDGTAPEGVSISGTGANATLTVAPGAKSGTATVKVASGDISDTIAITISRDPAAAAAVKVYGDGEEITGDTDTIVIPTKNAAEAKTKTYTAKALNQYGEEMGDPVTLSFPKTDANVTYSNGTVSVTKDAAKGAAYTLTATAGSVTKTITITLTDLEVNWTAVDSAMKSTMVYGTPNSGAATNLPATGTATAEGTLNGKFEILDPTDVPTVGSKTVTVRFTVTDPGDYQGIFVDKPYAVEVTKKPVTVKADNQTVTYFEEIPEPTFTVPNGALVGEDTKDDLNVIMDYDFGEIDEYPSAGTPIPIIGSDEDDNDNYDVTVTPGTLTVTKATIKQAGFAAPPAQPGDDLILVTEAPAYMLASNPDNTEQTMKETLKNELEEDVPATVIFGS